MALEMVNVVGFTSCSGYTPPALNTRAYNNYQFFTYGTDLLASAGGTYYVNTDTLKIFRRADNNRFLRVLGVNGANIGDVLITGNNFYGLAFAIDRSTQRGTIYCCYEQTGGAYKWQWDAQAGANYYNSNAVYNAILGAIQPTYTWQSVPSISGKNGILSLVTLDSESINDGEPVSGAAVSVFDQAPSNDNNIKNLADTYGGGEESSAVDVTVKYKVTLPPGGSFSTLKIVAKKDSIPENVSDGDKIVDISPSKTKKTVTGLDENSLYYFKIFGEDTNSNTSESDEKHITTSGDEGWLFDFTGSIQTFTAPKTGIYQLETWGAQGGDATDGTLTARGGYGAYAVGEVLLTQGDTLYINVGGQNGYGGGGNGEIEQTIENLAKGFAVDSSLIAQFTVNAITDYSIVENYPEYIGSEYWIYLRQSNGTPALWDNESNCIYSNNPSSYENIGSNTLIPINRIHAKKIEFDLTTNPYSGQNVYIYLLKIVSGSITLQETVYESYSTYNNQHFSIDCDSDVDYIGIRHGLFTNSGRGLEIRNLKFICTT